MIGFNFWNTIYFIEHTLKNRDAVYVRKWDPVLGYVSREEYFVGEIKSNNIDKKFYADRHLVFPDATLHRLAKATGYNYLADGCYRMHYLYYSGWICVPRHWELFDQTVSLDVFRKKYIDMFTVEYISAIGIPLTQAIMQIADIDVLTVALINEN